MKKHEDAARRTDDIAKPEDKLIQPLEPRAEAHDQPMDDDIEDDEDAEEDEGDRAGDL